MLDRVGVFVRVTRLVDGHWTRPKIPSFSADPDYGCLVMSLSADGQTIYFLSTRPLPDEPKKPGWGNQNIFCADRTAEGWGEPHPAPGAVCTMSNEYYPSLTRDGTMYFTRSPQGEPARLWRSRFVDGSFQEPEILPKQVNRGENTFNAFIAPDESYLIAPIDGHEENIGPTDYWISFRNANDQWSEAMNLGERCNGPEQRAGSAYVSPDGKYLFFSATHSDQVDFFPEGRLTLDGFRRLNSSPENGNSDIYWVDAAFLDDLRPDGWAKGD